MYQVILIHKSFFFLYCQAHKISQIKENQHEFKHLTSYQLKFKIHNSIGREKKNDLKFKKKNKKHIRETHTAVALIAFRSETFD